MTPPAQDYLVKKLGEELSLYLAIDDRTLAVTGEPIKGEMEAERRLLSRVDKVVCVSDVLADALRLRMDDSRMMPFIHVLPNGYDERLFDMRKTLRNPLRWRKYAGPAF